MKRFIAFFTALFLFITPTLADSLPASATVGLDINARSCLLMEVNTGEIIYAENENEKCSPASLSKIMTLLLGIEAVEAGKINLTDIVTCSKAVSQKQGSKVFLSENEKISVDELFKCIAVASGNDAAMALAEYMAGSEENFAKLMNNRAMELNLKNTSFENATGLDEEEGTENVSTAYDIAIMAKELMTHEMIFNYTTIWTDSIRNGEFTLTNSNKLVRYYSGTTGLKTGSTGKAGYCICATAKREDMHLMAVVMGADSAQSRNDEAKKLLDYGFANYAVLTLPKLNDIGDVAVTMGQKTSVPVEMIEDDSAVLISKEKKGQVTAKTEILDSVEAPVQKGQILGKVTYLSAGSEISSFNLVAKEAVPHVTLLFNLKKLISAISI